MTKLNKKIHISVTMTLSISFRLSINKRSKYEVGYDFF